MLNSFLVAMLISTLILLVITKKTADRLIHQHYNQKNDFFKQHPIQSTDIVFVGDSLTDGARWDEIFPEYPVKNRGINADLTTGVLNRLKDITDRHPVAIFLLIGTNDLPWYEYRTDNQILETYENILCNCREDSPETKIYIQSILPRGRSYTNRILFMNKEIEILSNKYHCTYIPLFPHFADASGALRNDITNDHLHLLGSGYAIWKEQLTPYLRDLYSKNTDSVKNS